MVDEAELKALVCAQGYRDLVRDPSEPSLVTLFPQEGEPQQAYLRFARKPSRFANEEAALRLIHQKLGTAPVPQLLLSLPEVGDGLLVVSYLPGLNLADFIPVGADIPTMPLAYQRSQPETEAGLLGSLVNAGKAVRRLHEIDLPRFCLLDGAHPNPHLHNARLYTQQEARHMLSRVGALGYVSDVEAKHITVWLEERLPLIGETEPATLTHFDLHAGNVRFCVRDGRIQFLAIFDFELARGWLPEDDLALLSWYLRVLPGGWEAFCEGYVRVVDKQRLEMFEMIKALTAVAYSKNDYDWRDWCRNHIQKLLLQ
ncbi:MAG: hypothetical protein CL608_03895 [Anaerolineaceae bacterium]|nr:hypothetical protein [Anaerolineaceae bacterium]